MENKNNGRGIFYGVIGVATLVVAIIGATFAYFTATISQNNAINVGSTTVKLAIGTQESNFKTNLIPVDTYTVTYDTDGVTEKSRTPNTAFYRYPGLTTTGKGTGTCVDDNGNSICSVYQVEVKNPQGSAAQYIEGALTPVANTGFEDMEYAVFSGTADTVGKQTNKFEVHGTKSAATQAGNGALIYQGKIGGTTELNKEQLWGENSKVLLEANQSTVYTIVVWLEDTGKEQNAQQGKVFAASVRFFSAAGSEVKGVISAS